ncbi:MAG: ribonuclease Y, partial [Bacilli bacterium]
MNVLSIVLIFVAFVLGVVIMVVLNNLQITKAKSHGLDIIEQAKREAINIEKAAILEAKTTAHEFMVVSEQEIKVKKQEINEMERSLQKKNQEIDRKDVMLLGRQEMLINRENELSKKNDKLLEELKVFNDEKENYVEMLERISGYSKSQAKAELIDEVKKLIENETSAMIKDAEEQAKETAEEKAKDIIAFAINRYTAEQSNERTIAAVALPSEDMKGRIIGREGRNIRAIEAACGVDLIIDDTPEVITVSCFDPIRREIAKRSIEMLIDDGRIQPTRIEEIVNKSRSELDKIIKKTGEEAVFELGLTNVPKEIVTLIGKLKYRTSYGQSALKHSMEVAFLSGMMAAEIGEDEMLARRAGLLHDIGKAIDFEQEGSHVELGAAITRKYKEHDFVVNAIEAHHGNQPFMGIIPILVTAADALSASRPGARAEALGNYIKRLEQLETITKEFK